MQNLEILQSEINSLSQLMAKIDVQLTDYLDVYLYNAFNNNIDIDVLSNRDDDVYADLEREFLEQFEENVYEDFLVCRDKIKQIQNRISDIFDKNVVNS